MTRGLLAWMVLITLTAGAAVASPEREVDGRVAAWKIRSAEMPFDRIAWSKDLPEALRLARARGRLVFLIIDRGDVVTGRA